MPRIKYTVTDYWKKATLAVHYTCSSCGAENHCNQEISSDVRETALDGGLFVTGTPKAAADSMAKIIQQLKSNDHIHRYDLAGFDCSCRNCGKREPWAKMRSKYISKFQQKLFAITVALLLLSVICLIFMLIIEDPYEWKKSMTALWNMFLLALLPGICYLMCVLYKLCKRILRHKQIAKLPTKSLPIITAQMNYSQINTFISADMRRKTAAPVQPDVQKKCLREQLSFAMKCQTPEKLRQYLNVQMPHATELERATFEKLLAHSDEEIMHALKQEMDLLNASETT